MKLECDVIRDLLPLYAEKLASPPAVRWWSSTLQSAPPAVQSWNRWKSRCRCSRSPSRMHR